MQLNQNSNPSSTNIETKVPFGISKNSTKLFSMLSTSLYSQKEVAVMYEIGANCSDAHALNGNQDKPWDLICPTQLDPTIRFRDYGPGLDEDQVNNLLTTYGESTKSDSNDYIGAYGIGSKSPAAVTSNWTVISRHEGMLKEYFVFIDVNGVPSLSKIREQETEDASGLEVIIPVAHGSFYAWVDKINSVYRYYTVKPNVINHTPNWSMSKPKFVGSNFVIRGFSTWGQNLKFITTQREYTYSKAIEKEFETEDFRALLSSIMLEVAFPIGSLETSLSREDIQYTKLSIENIRKTMRGVFSELRTHLDTILNASTDRFDFSNIVYAAAREVFGSNDAVDMVLYVASPNKYNIKKKSELRHYTVTLDDFENVCKPRISNGTSLAKLTHTSTCFKTYYISLDKRFTSPKITYKVSFLLENMDRIIIVINDDKHTASKVKYNFKGKYALIVDKNVFPAELSRFIVYASTLQSPPKVVVPREKKAVVKSSFYSIRQNSMRKIDITSSVYAGKVLIGVPVENAHDMASVNKFDSLAKIINKLSDTEIVAYKKGTAVPANFTDIEVYARNFVAEHNNQQYFTSRQQSEFKYALETSTYNHVIYLLGRDAITSTVGSVWNNLVEMIKVAKTHKGSHSGVHSEVLVSLCDHFNVSKNTQNVVWTVDKICGLVYTTYPMIKHVSRDTNAKDVVDYITLIGK